MASQTFVRLPCASSAIFKRSSAQCARFCVRAEAVNPAIQKDVDKVVHTISSKDINKKAVYCRCWRSTKFPLCDGSHAKYNKETGDNVGPLIIAVE